jgi:tetratricopeptide (TPR) repeat protein
MRDTASYRVISGDPDQRELSRARWLAGEGRREDALDAYRDVLTRLPEVLAAWAEGFEILRRMGHRDEALTWAREARALLPDAAFSFALEGAALIDLARYRDAIASLEHAVDRDPDLALVWHELGLAAHRLGESSRALAALDRAFALEPHTETLLLRGRVLLEAGRYAAAEVSFEGAAQGAPFDEQRHEAETLIRTARRQALFPGRRPAEMSTSQQFFVRTGAVVLASAPGQASDEDLLDGFTGLTADSGWMFGQLVVLGDPTPFGRLADALELQIEPETERDPGRVPLLVGTDVRPGWREVSEQLASTDQGLSFLLEHPASGAASADVVGRLAKLSGACDPSCALLEAQHPASRAARRRFAVVSVPAGD